jgi:DNA-binding response OmpR family regulator
MLSREQLVQQFWPDRPFRQAYTCLKVHMHNMRKQAARHGWRIENVWSQGYFLPAECRQVAIDALATQSH